MRTGWAIIALRTDATVVPLAMAGTEELYLGRRMASRVLPPRTARELAGLEAGAPLPAPGTREELATARAMTDRLAELLDPVIQALHLGTRGPTRAPAPAAAPAHVAVAATRPTRSRRLTARFSPRSVRLYSPAMQYAETILDLVGNTPLVRISRVTRDLGPEDRQPLLLAKMEMLNPGGSVKDRIGLPMIEAAERDGLLKPGGTIIEPTSGNTGHGLAIAAALKGYRCIFVMADKQSTEKQALLRAYGAQVVLCPTNVPPESPESYYSVAARLARDIPGAFKPDQYWNKENPAAHEQTTGPELWDQTEGRITHFVASVGHRRDDLGGGARPEAAQPRDPGHRGGSGGLDPVGRHRAAVPDRGRRRGLPAGHVRPVRGRSLGPGQRPRRLRDGAPVDARGGDPRRRVVRHGDGGRA